MKKMYEHSECLSYEHLKMYCEKSMNKEEQKEIYKHLSGCELCAYAVNGFTAVPFSQTDIKRMEQKIDAKIKPLEVLPKLPFAKVMAISAVLLFSLGYYVFNDNGRDTKPQTAVLMPANTPVSALPEHKMRRTPDSIIPTQQQKQVYLSTPSLSANSMKKAGAAEKTPPAKREEAEKLPTLEVTIHELFFKEGTSENVTRTMAADEVMYIDDFKVVDYSRFYVEHSSATVEINGSTPASKENKNTTEDANLKTNEQKSIAVEVLKTSFHELKQQHYLEANTGFMLLIDKNKNDVNALFYSGICCMQLSNYSLAAKRFRSVLKYSNPQFEEEATWKLALTCLKMGDKEQANELFKEIIDYGGFYAERAGRFIGSGVH